MKAMREMRSCGSTSSTSLMSLSLSLTLALILASASLPARAQRESFDACIDALRRERPQHAQVRAESFDKYTRDAQDLRPIIEAATENQPEFKLPIWDYTARLVDAQRIADGRGVLASRAAPLQAIASAHGVDAATIVAVFGVETDYGRVEGRHRVVDATLSRACLDLASKERKRHFFAALWLLQQGLVQPDNFRGSWAGAFGQTQFMPGTFVAHMADGDASGSVDIVGSALDALATTARYVSSLGWSAGLRWGVEVTGASALRPDMIASEREHACLTGTELTRESSGKCRTVEQWAALGVAVSGPTSLSGPPPGVAGLPAGTRTALIAPGGADGPAWLVTHNYRAIWQYNRADAYALSIGLLADALRGDPATRNPWPTDDTGLSRAELRQLQEALIRRGHTEVTPDGRDGPRTRAAVQAEEVARGWPATGRPGKRIAQVIANAPDSSPATPP